MTAELPTDSGKLTTLTDTGREGLPLDELALTSGARSLSVLLVEHATCWRYVRNMLLAIIGLYGGATLGCNLGAPAMGIEHRQSVMAVWQLAFAGGLIGGLGLVITARRQRGLFLLFLVFGTSMGAGAAAGAGAMGWWFGSPDLSVRVENYGIETVDEEARWYGPTRRLTVVMAGIALGAFLGGLLGLGRGRLGAGVIIGTIAASVIGVGALLLGHPDPSTLFGAFVGLAAVSFLWRFRGGDKALCRTRVITIALAGIAGVAAFWLQALYWPRTIVLVPEPHLFFRGHPTVALSSDGSRVMGACRGSVYLWNCKIGVLISVVKGNFPAIGFSQHDTPLAVRDFDGGFELWDVERAKSLGPTDRLRPDPIKRRPALSHDGDRLLTGGEFLLFNTVELRNGAMGDLIRPFLHHNCTMLYQGGLRFSNLAISADGKWAASIDWFGVVRVWRLPD